jgi:hypothetical protein
VARTTLHVVYIGAAYTLEFPQHSPENSALALVSPATAVLAGAIMRRARLTTARPIQRWLRWRRLALVAQALAGRMLQLLRGCLLA